MKKRLLFILNNLECGGAEKALTALFSTIDYDRYEVDLFLFRHSGMFLRTLPKEVHLLPEPMNYKYFDMPFRQAFMANLKRLQFPVLMARVAMGFFFSKYTHSAICNQKTWPYLARTLPRLQKNYDAAIAYMEGNPIYFLVDKVQAKKKIGFIHNDYDHLGYQSEFDQHMFKKLERLVTVSEQCAATLRSRFPSIQDRVDVMYNIVSPRLIREMARKDMISPIDQVSGSIHLISIGRLNEQKGFDMAIDACKLLVERGIPVTWKIIGEGAERSLLEAQIRRNGLENQIQMLGLRDNPYPYISKADIYVQPSRFEGKSIALDEAKILHKPIVVTNYSTVHDQIEHEHNGLIVEMNPASIADGIQRLVEDQQLRKRLIEGLEHEDLGTEHEIEKLYAYIE